ncbi:uncharacterized protein B0T23DRAFT_317049 [Neurospora hispaniola]|uniref:Uncharacterized protein n=1 Tax=Neurospora hispaniola TaxID=588809 RepID=A0AAJ0I8T5_9PEZI|nr:hypothetical protein B0T23DRAFT_317049 [Neurospora hispaniola]
MEANPPTTPPGPSKRKSPSSHETSLPQARNQKRQRIVEREEPSHKLSDPSPHQHTTSPKKILESEHEDEESEGESIVSDPTDNEFEGATGNQPHIADDLDRAIHRNTRRPILVPVEPELSTSDIDDLLSNSEFDLDSGEEESNSTTKGSPSRRIAGRNEEGYYVAMSGLEYYNSLPEPDLRREAIRWMEENSRADPKGTVVYPPPWYIATRFDPPRPRLWIKDFFSGRVRPRQLVNDRLAEMTVAQREEWAREHGMGGYDDDDTE